MARPWKLSPAQQRELAELRAEPRCTNQHIAQILGLDYSTVKDYIQRLRLPKRRNGFMHAGTSAIHAHMAKVRAGRRQGTARCQLERCERALAAQQPELPAWRRCPVCQGREWTAQPHQHAA